MAAWAIIAATVFDMLDGRIARMARATSRFGVEYDSLSDLVSFGMAPAFCSTLGNSNRSVDSDGGGFRFPACGALRLARFNVTSESGPKGYFQACRFPAPQG